MENNNFNKGNFNGEKIKESTGNVGGGGIRDIDVPQRKYLQENKFKEIDLSHKKTSFWKKMILMLIFTLILSGVITYFFHTATFNIKNNLKDINFTNDILKANIIDTKKGEELPFNILEFSVVLDKDVKSKMIESVSEKAVGKIKIINNTSKVQKLRKETRFEIDGKIFKTYKSVSIPAKSSVIKEAFSDMPGEEYNVKKGGKMVIPGFKEAKDLDSFKMITGEVAEDFKGGFVGKKDIPDKEDLEKKKKILAEEIDSTIMIKARTKLPKDFILNTDGIFTEITYKTEKKDGYLKLVGEANVKCIIFDKSEFLSVVSGLDKEKIKNYNINSTAFLKFKILNKKDISLDSLKSFTFEINGLLKYDRNFEENEFINLVRGKNKAELNKLLEKSYEEFTIETKIFPF